MIIDTTKVTHRTQEEMEADFIKFRGNCKPLCEESIRQDSSLRLVRGHYYCPLWGKQPHWWCETSKGEIFDPSVRQFPTMGFAAVYEEFNGMCQCAECGKEIPEEKAVIADNGNYAFCSNLCYGKFIGVY